jgi:DNA-binding CsgD family transcriptional regulator
MMRPFDEDRMLNLVGLTYDAALDERLWAGLAGKVANAFKASSMSLRLRRTGAGRSLLLASTDNLLFTNAQEYASYYWRHDKWATRGAELGMSKVVVSKELISDEELDRSEWYWDWARKADIFYIVGVVFPTGDGELIGLGIHRARREGDFEKQDKRPVAQFLPHLKRALQLRHRLFANNVERDATLDALDRTGIATFVVAQDGLILYANRHAEIILQQGDGIGATHSRLGLSDHEAGKALAKSIKTAVNIAAGESPAAPPRAFAIRRGNRLPITVLVSPFRPARDGFGLPMPAAIVLARDPEWPTASQAALQSMFGLTAAEACIARELASGRSVNDIAACHGITLNTTRTHIKNIFAKTDTNRQPELVALLSATVATLTRTQA